MFEPYIDGLIEKVTSILRDNDKDFGIGGIGKIGKKCPQAQNAYLMSI